MCGSLLGFPTRSDTLEEYHGHKSEIPLFDFFDESDLLSLLRKAGRLARKLPELKKRRDKFLQLGRVGYVSSVISLGVLLGLPPSVLVAESISFVTSKPGSEWPPILYLIWISSWILPGMVLASTILPQKAYARAERNLIFVESLTRKRIADLSLKEENLRGRIFRFVCPNCLFDDWALVVRKSAGKALCPECSRIFSYRVGVALAVSYPAGWFSGRHARVRISTFEGTENTIDVEPYVELPDIQAGDAVAFFMQFFDQVYHVRRYRPAPLVVPIRQVMSQGMALEPNKNKLASNVPSQMESYIKTCLAQGFKAEQIRQSLLKNGWQEKDIDASFDRVAAEK